MRKDKTRQHPATHTPDRHLRKSLNIRVPDELKERLVLMVTDEGATQTQILLDAIDKHLTSKGY
jgi:predicted DNA-binding protein